MYAVLVINIEASLEGAFHYDIPRDLEPVLQIGHLVEVEFGRRLAQGIVIAFDEQAPVADVKPIIALIDEEPVVLDWQIELAQWLSTQYLAPLNGCLRLMLPPGLTRWSDVVVDINPYWDGNGRLTETQQQLIDLLREKGDLRGRQIRRLMPKTDWKKAITQLANRNILRKASVLDPPRVPSLNKFARRNLLPVRDGCKTPYRSWGVRISRQTYCCIWLNWMIHCRRKRPFCKPPVPLKNTFNPWR